MRCGAKTLVTPAPASSPKRRITLACVPLCIAECIDSTESHIEMVVMRRPATLPVNDRKPGSARLSLTVRRDNWRTSCTASSLSAISSVTARTPDAAGRPVRTVVATPNTNGPIARGCTIASRPG